MRTSVRIRRLVPAVLTLPLAIPSFAVVSTPATTAGSCTGGGAVSAPEDLQAASDAADPGATLTVRGHLCRQFRHR